MKPKIIQLLMAPNTERWQGILLGLGDDGVTYEACNDGWNPLIKPIENNSINDIRAAAKELGFAVVPLDGLEKLARLNSELRERIPFDARYPELTRLSLECHEVFTEAGE